MNQTSKAVCPTDEQRTSHLENIQKGVYTRQDLIRLRLWPLKYTHAHIHSVRELKETLRAGKYAWPGGYPLYFITADSEALSFESAHENFRSIVHAMTYPGSPDWRIVACTINYEDQFLYCSHSEQQIESAFGDDE